MAIESKKTCETCSRRELPKCEWPCCNCYGDNGYKHFKERDDDAKETVNYLSLMVELIDILNEFEKDYTGESAFNFGNKEVNNNGD